MTVMRFTSCQAPIAEYFMQAVTDYVGQRLGLDTRLVNDINWPERARQFDTGQIDVCWLCGVPYVWRADQPAPTMELLAAPVMAAPRYQDCPIYFSDVVVRHDSAYQSLADLRGATWAINERASQSGYFITRYHLALLGERTGFFGRVIESGAHQASLELILNSQIDASAIDSTVLELLVERDPALRQQLRTVAVFGPSPIPPWVINTSVPPELRAALRDTLIQMHTDPTGQAILHSGQTARFAAVQDHDYDLIRQMLRLGQTVTL